MRWTLILERKTENSLNPAIARRHLSEIAEAAGRNKSLGFVGRIGKLAEPETILEEGREKKRYLVRLRLEETEAKTAEQAKERYGHVRKVVERCAAGKEWSVIDGDGQGSSPADGDSLAPVKAEPRKPFCPVDLTDEVIAREFAEVYERDAHIRILNDAVQTFVVTGGAVRAHTILYGRPGGCKTTLLDRMKALYDDEVERMMILDASTMTKAGFETWVLDRVEQNSFPEIMVIEEIEKVDNKDNLKALGSIMASGYLMRTNARIGRVMVPVGPLVIATCNDEEGLKAFMRGYIWDRFTNQLFCPLPSRAVMYRILMDKIRRIENGRAIWAKYAMNLADRMGVRTPRKIIGFLAGRYRLETGKYQDDQLAIVDGMRAEEAGEAVRFA